MTANYYAHIHAALTAQPDRVALVWPNEDNTHQTHTGRELLDQLSAIRAGLAAAGVLPGQSVLMAAPVSVGVVAALLGVMSAGAVPVLPPAGTSALGLLRFVRRHRFPHLLTAQPLPRPVAWLLRRLGTSCLALTTLPQPVPNWLSPYPVDPEQPALISHSSGSTGQPKAIRRSHRVLSAQHRALENSFPAWPGQRDFPLFPNVILHNLAVGTVSVLPNVPGFRLAKLDPARIVAQLADQQIDTLTGNVYYFGQLLTYLTNHPQTFTQVRKLGIGGSPVPDVLLFALQPHFPNATLYVIYGSSEAEPMAVRAVGTLVESPRAGYVVGAAHPAVELRIEPLGTLSLPDGRAVVAGEIQVRGPHVVGGADGWFRTGDYGYLTDDQQLVLTGRRGNERIRRGIQHYQIEHVLLSVAGVRRAAARATETGFAVFVEGVATEATLRQVLNEQFPDDLIEQLLFRDTLPVDARHLSKIRYDALR